MKQGNILVGQSGIEYKIMGVCGECYFISKPNNFNKIEPEPLTRGEIEGLGYKLK